MPPLRLLCASVLLLAMCQHPTPKEASRAPSKALPPPVPDSVLAAQRAGRAYALDTMAIVTNQRLHTLLSLVEDRTLVSYSSARALPTVVAGFLQTRGSADHPFVLADVGAPFRATDVILDPSLPSRQLVYLGVSSDLVLLSYYSGGVGLNQHVVIFRLHEHTIKDLWNGYVSGDPRTKSELLQQVRQSHEDLYRRRRSNSGGLFF